MFAAIDLALKNCEDISCPKSNFAARVIGSFKDMVVPPNTSPANFCIRPTSSLVLIPVWSGFAMTSVTVPPKSEKTTAWSKLITTDGVLVTTRVNFWLTDASPSLTDNSTSESPAVVGVPVNAPEAASNVAQAGKVTDE